MVAGRKFLTSYCYSTLQELVANRMTVNGLSGFNRRRI